LTRLPIIDFETADKLLRDLGFRATRQKGSHVFYRHSDGRTTTVPNHPGRDLARPLLREILHEIELSIDDLNEMLKRV